MEHLELPSLGHEEAAPIPGQKKEGGGGTCSVSTRLSTSLHESPDLHCKPLLLGAPSLLAVPLGLEATQNGNDSFQLVEVIKHR